MKKGNAVGGLYFLIHLMVEITSFYVLTTYMKTPYLWTLMLVYDFAAFVPQGAFGYLRDRGLRVNFALWGTVLTSSAMMCLILNANYFLTVMLLALGNGLVHIQGAELTLRTSCGKMAPSAAFVSGGSFGVVTGQLLASGGASAQWVLALNLLTFVPIMLAERLKDADGTENLRHYRFDNPKIRTGVIVALAVFVVAVRSYMGYGIPTSWNKTVLQTVALYAALGLGKMLGGVLVDRIGIRKTALISTIGALPFLLFGENLMVVSLIGIACFSMTMAVTLALLVSRLQTMPGVAFGLTTVGLFAGLAPVFFFRIRSVFINCVMISILSVLCMVILGIVCAGRTKQTEQSKKE